MQLDEDHLRLIETRAEALEAMTCLATLDTLLLITELRRMRESAEELRALASEKAAETTY